MQTPMNKGATSRRRGALCLASSPVPAAFCGGCGGASRGSALLVPGSGSPVALACCPGLQRRTGGSGAASLACLRS